MYFSTSDSIYFATVVVFASCGFLANALLLFMIIWKSPEHLSPYRIFLGNTSLTQLLFSVVSVVTAPRLLSEGFSILTIYLGPSQLLGPWYNSMLSITMLHLALNSSISLMVSMIYRCISLRYSNIKISISVLMCLGGYVIPLSLIFLCLSLKYSANVTEADQVTHHMVPNIEKYSVVSANILQIPVLWTMFCTVVLPVPIYVTMYYCRRKILTILEETDFAHSQQTKVIIKHFALTVQSLVPSVSVFAPAVVYPLIHIGALEPQLFGYFIVPCIGIGPVIDPLITMYYVGPYRRFVSATLLSHPFTSPHTRHMKSNMSKKVCTGMSTTPKNIDSRRI